MKHAKLYPITYQDAKVGVRVTDYADTIVYDASNPKKNLLCAVRFGGYPEAVRSLADGIWGGGQIQAEIAGETLYLECLPKQYRKQLSHDGAYAEATLVADENLQSSTRKQKDEDGETDATDLPPDLPPRSAYIFCAPDDRGALFREIDRKTAVPLIPEFQDYLLAELERRGDLKALTVRSLSRPFDAWVLRCAGGDANIISAVEDGIAGGAISIPGGRAGPSPFGEINSVMDYLSIFGQTLAQRIKELFVPLFDPASEPLSPEILAINDFIQETAGYSLYDAQLAVAESVKRRLEIGKVALVIAECGSGKTKIGATALGALWGLHARQGGEQGRKTFNIVLCPSHMKKKWVREIEETLPAAFAAEVTSIQGLNRLYQFYQQGNRSCYAVINKEKARDGYMRRPCAQWRLTPAQILSEERDNIDVVRRANQARQKAFVCPDCNMPVQKRVEGVWVNADQFFFQKEHRDNHKCTYCGTPLWTTLNPNSPTDQAQWIKVGDYGFVFRPHAMEHLNRTKNPAILEKLAEIMAYPQGRYPAVGAYRSYPLSTYIKNHYRGRIDGLLCDELHEYAQNSGQGDAMGELVQAAKKAVGMTATLINGYSSGIFYLLYRIAAPLLERDGQSFRGLSRFNDEYGVVQHVYETEEADYNSNRKTAKIRKRSRMLPGVSPMVYSRFLLESAVFLSLMDMGKELPEYEEIPIPLRLPDSVRDEYKRLENILTKFMKEERRYANKILSAYMNLLTAYPDQPYRQPSILHPLTGKEIVVPGDTSDYETLSPKDKKLLEIVERKMAAGEKVIVYTNWVRLDTQKKVKELLTKHGYRTEILESKVPPSKREKWVQDHIAKGIQVMITNPTNVETGLDLNDFTTLIFYDTGYKLFTFRQASRRSWRINQYAPRVEIYILYYQDTMQHKAIKLMASKLAVAGIIEGNLSDEGLAAMSEAEDMASIMAKELAAGIKDSVEDVSAMFKKMAFLKPEQPHENRSVPIRQLESECLENANPTHPGRIAPPALAFAPPTGSAGSLLERSIEIQRKSTPKKAMPVLEGQFSFFDGISA